MILLSNILYFCDHEFSPILSVTTMSGLRLYDVPAHRVQHFPFQMPSYIPISAGFRMGVANADVGFLQ